MVEDEVDTDLGSVGPVGVGRVRTVADEVALHPGVVVGGVGHGEKAVVVEETRCVLSDLRQDVKRSRKRDSESERPEGGGKRSAVGGGAVERG